MFTRWRLVDVAHLAANASPYFPSMSVVRIDQIKIGQSLYESSNSVNGQVFEFENSYADPLTYPTHKRLTTRHKQL
jgi:hypothetical protein